MKLLVIFLEGDWTSFKFHPDANVVSFLAEFVEKHIADYSYANSEFEGDEWAYIDYWFSESEDGAYEFLYPEEMDYEVVE